MLTPPLTPPLIRGGWEGLGGVGRSGGVGCSADAEEVTVEGAKVAFLPYNKNLTALARENRKNPAKAESKMWNDVLSMRRFSEFKFLRQKPLAGYIVDFYCSELRLVIEIDGDSHADTIEYDAERTLMLNALGLTVIRYTNDEVLSNIEGVFENLIRRVWREEE